MCLKLVSVLLKYGTKMFLLFGKYNKIVLRLDAILVRCYYFVKKFTTSLYL